MRSWGEREPKDDDVVITPVERKEAAREMFGDKVANEICKEASTKEKRKIKRCIYENSLEGR